MSLLLILMLLMSLFIPPLRKVDESGPHNITELFHSFSFLSYTDIVVTINMLIIPPLHSFSHLSQSGPLDQVIQLAKCSIAWQTLKISEKVLFFQLKQTTIHIKLQWLVPE